jgi:aminoglycoside phosphotransferase (APT) family kinase protein
MEISVALVKQLIETQFPQWADLPITPIVPGGWDNRTFHLGNDMTVRMPSAAVYAAQVEKEQRWLPLLAPLLPLPIPIPRAKGVPSSTYPWPWSIYGWIEGESAITARIADLSQVAATLAQFLAALQRIDATNGPAAGQHSFFRGAPLTMYDAETRDTLKLLEGEIDSDTALAVWEAALAAPWHGPPVWFHGDIAAGNLLLKDGALCAVIDFGCSGVGDPACDLAIAWTLFEGTSRNAFRAALPIDAAMWARGRGWALWKALITLEEYRSTDAVKATAARRTIEEVLADDMHT